MSRDKVIGIATSYGLDGRVVEIRVPVGSRIFFFLRRPYQFWAPPASYPLGSGGTFLGGEVTGALS
jgi:hypothetical protein